MLVEDEGEARVRRARPLSSSGEHVDRTFDFLVCELARLRIGVAGVQETKWFGSDVWHSGGYTMVHSGRRLLLRGASARRGEGVGIVMNPVMSAAWHDGGEQSQTVSSRVVSARFPSTRSGDDTA